MRKHQTIKEYPETQKRLFANEQEDLLLRDKMKSASSPNNTNGHIGPKHEDLVPNPFKNKKASYDGVRKDQLENHTNFQIQSPRRIMSPQKLE